MRAMVLAVYMVGCSIESGARTLSETGADTGTTTLTGTASSSSDTGGLPDEMRVGRFSVALHRRMASLATVRWEQSDDEPVHIEYSIDPGVWLSAPPVDGHAGINEQLIVGIPFSEPAPAAPRAVPWRVVFEDDGYVAPASMPIEPGPADPDLPVPALTVAVPEQQYADGSYLLTTINQENGGWTSGQFWVAIYDRVGRPVWALQVPDHHWSLAAQVARDGDSILWDESTTWSDGDQGAGSEVHRTYLDGEMWALGTPGLHHGFAELPDGSIGWASRSPEHGEGESIVEARPDTATTFVVWRCEDWSEAPVPAGTCQASELIYNDARDSYLLGLESSRTVVEVDRAAQAAVWWAGEDAGGYRFSPASAQFSDVHGLQWTPDGSLLVTTEMPGTEAATAVREYTVSRTSRTLSQVWSYDADLYATVNPRAARLENGNTLHVLGSASQIKEVQPDGRTVWFLDFQGTRLLGRGSFIDDLYDLVSPVVE